MQESPPARRHQHVRTKSGSADQSRTRDLTAGMPAVTAAVDGQANGGGANGDKLGGGASGGGGGDGSNNPGVFRDYLIRKPTRLLKGLLRSGVGVVQNSMDTFQNVSTTVFKAVKLNTTAAPRSVRIKSPSDADDPSAADDPPDRHWGNTMATIVNTGISGVEQMTDFGLLIGNIGTHKIRAGLDGKDGNQEIFNLLIKYAGTCKIRPLRRFGTDPFRSRLVHSGQARA